MFWIVLVSNHPVLGEKPFWTSMALQTWKSQEVWANTAQSNLLFEVGWWEHIIDDEYESYEYDDNGDDDDDNDNDDHDDDDEDDQRN